MQVIYILTYIQRERERKERSIVTTLTISSFILSLIAKCYTIIFPKSNILFIDFFSPQQFPTTTPYKRGEKEGMKKKKNFVFKWTTALKHKNKTWKKNHTYIPKNYRGERKKNWFWYFIFFFFFWRKRIFLNNSTDIFKWRKKKKTWKTAKAMT